MIPRVKIPPVKGTPNRLDIKLDTMIQICNVYFVNSPIFVCSIFVAKSEIGKFQNKTVLCRI